MADTDVLEILIKTVYDATGVRLSREDAKRLQGTIAETSKATEDLGESNAKAAKHAEHSEISHRALHQILHLIAEQSGPGVGAALAGVAAASQGSMLIAIMAVRGLFEWIEKAKAAAEEAAQINAQAWINQQAAIQNATTAAEDFARGLDHVKTVTAQLEQQFEKEKAVLDAQIDGHKKLLDAIEKEQLAEANGNKEKEDEIKERFDDLKREYDVTAELIKLEQERTQLRKLEATQGSLASAATAAESSKEAALSNQGAAEVKARLDKQDENKLKEAYDAARERIERSASGPTVETARAEAEAMMAEDKDVQAFLAYENDKKAMEAHEWRVKQLTEAADKAVKARDENTAAIQKQSEQVDRDSAVSREHQTSTQRERAIDDIRRLGGDKEISGLVEASASNMNALLHGQKLSEGQLQTNAILENLMKDLGYTSQANLRILNALAADQAQAKSLIADLERRVGQIRSSVDRPRQ